MSADISSTSVVASQEPIRVVQVGATQFTLLGTAHVSKASADEVRRLITSQEFDAVAVELCAGRFKALQDPDSLAKLDLFQVLKEGKAGLVAANLALGSFQQRVAEEEGIQPGAEMLVALEEAQKINLPLLAIDRDLGVTLKRIYTRVPWWQRASLIMGLVTSLFSKEKVGTHEIEKLKQGDMLEYAFADFAAESQLLHTSLIAERDTYMALRLQQEMAKQPYKKVLVVVGAGHLQGLVSNLQRFQPADPQPELDVLCHLPPKKKWLKVIPWLIVAVIVAGFVLGFSQDKALGTQMIINWILINGGLAALGAIMAAGHPLTILASFLAAPITSLNPTIGVGFVSAGVELYLRKPKVEDFSAVRKDTVKISGWWKNRVARTLLVFIFTTLGSALGTYIGGFYIYGQIVG